MHNAQVRASCSQMSMALMALNEMSGAWCRAPWRCSMAQIGLSNAGLAFSCAIQAQCAEERWSGPCESSCPYETAKTICLAAWRLLCCECIWHELCSKGACVSIDTYICGRMHVFCTMWPVQVTCQRQFFVMYCVACSGHVPDTFWASNSTVSETVRLMWKLGAAA